MCLPRSSRGSCHLGFNLRILLLRRRVLSALRSGGLCTYLYWPLGSMVFAADEATSGLLDLEFVAV